MKKFPVNFCILYAIIMMSLGVVHGQPLNLSYSHILVDRHSTKIYNPTHEFIFPCVITTEHIANPLGKYYLYYAPHDAPAGICLAYSDNIQGPYTEYKPNPILKREALNVSHISSPHVIWMSQYNKYFLYFHGENTTTRWAHSTDGINWELANDNFAINTAMWGSGFTECSYARVFEYGIPGVGNRYVMMMMLINSGFGRRIGLAISNDGKHFTPYDEALISQGPGEGSDIAAPFYWPYQGKHYVLYHGSSGNMYYTEVGAGFDQEIHHGVFYDPQSHYPEYNKAASPFLIYADGRWNMFFDVGLRLQQSIAYAFQTPTTNNIYVDNTDNAFSFGGSWAASTATEGFYGVDYLHDNGAGADPGDWAKWKPNFPQSGYYKVMVRWPAYNNRPDHIKYKIYHQGEVTEVYKNQTERSGSWIYLGRYNFSTGSSEANRLTLDAGSDEGYTIADAAWFIFDGNSSNQTPVTESRAYAKEPGFDQKYFEGLNMYPNPANDHVNIAYVKLQSETVVMQLLDMSGRLILEKPLRNEDRVEEEIETKDLPEGIYFLHFEDRFEGSVRVASYKIIINH